MLFTLLSFIIMIGVLVFFHELGHFMVARACGVYIKDFSIGMGPVIYQVKGAETTYSLRALPIGGAVQMLGEDGVDKELAEDENAPQKSFDASDNPRSFTNKPAWQRFLIIAAGPLMNFALAIVLFFLIFFFQGFPSNQNYIGAVMAETPAMEAGLQADDKIVAVDGRTVSDWFDIVEAINAAEGNKILLQIERADQTKQVELTPRYNEQMARYIIGISQKMETSLGQSVYYAFVKTWDSTRMIIEIIPKLISGEVSRDNLTGPIGIAQISGQAARQGPLVFMSLMAIISVNLGIMNLLPIPALDGGRLLLIALELIFRRKLPAFIEEKIHLIGFALLMLLMIYVVFNDIVRLF